MKIPNPNMSILTAQQKMLFERLSHDRLQNASVLEKRSMRGVKQRVIEKYSDTAHFIYELLQNADDVKASTARFMLNDAGIIFAHNGTIHFSLSDPDTEEMDTQNNQLGHINAITSIGNSNKYEAQIGKFGVGFKAVFQYTNTPEIYDPLFCFKIDRFIVPVLLDNDHPNRQTSETLFYFPFDNPSQSISQSFQTILAKLKNLTNPLLFMRHLTQITWQVSDGSQGKYVKEENRQVKFPQSGEFREVSLNLVSVSATVSTQIIEQHTQNFLVFTSQLNTHPFSIAYLTRLSEMEQPVQILSNRVFPAYCFFATKETTQLRFMVQAPFLLTDNREGIKHGESWNQQLMTAIAQLTAKSLSWFKHKGLLTEDFLNVLPINEADFPPEHLFRAVYDAVLDALQTQSLLPTQGESYISKEKAYLAADLELLDLLTSEQLSQIVNNDDAQWVFPNTTPENRNLWEYVKNHLVTQTITQEELINRLTPKFIHSQSDAWLMQFYAYLIEKPYYLKHKKELLKAKPFLRLTNDKLVSACNRVGKIQVYLPSDSDSEYPTIKSCFAEDEKSLQFLRVLGLDKPKAYEEIKYYILPRYQQQSEIDSAVLLRDFRKLFWHFLHCPQSQKAEYLTQLKKLPFCRTSYAKNNRTVRLPPSVIYFPTDALKNYFSHYPEVYFLEVAFYGEFYQIFGKAPVEQFFQTIGVQDKPSLLKIDATLSASQKKAIHQGKCTRDYSLSSQETYDYDLEGLDACLSYISLEKSRVLWQFLLTLIEENAGQDIFTGQYHWFYRRERYHNFDAKFIITLRQSAWLYNNQGKCVKPADIVVVEMVAYETTSYAAKVLIEKLDISTERLTGFTEAQKDRYAFGEEIYQLATATGKEPKEILTQFKHFLTQTEKTTSGNEMGSDVLDKLPPSSNMPTEPSIDAFVTDTVQVEAKDALPQDLVLSTLPENDTLADKRAQLEEQHSQKIHEITTIEALQSRISQMEKYSFAWFKALLELESLLNTAPTNARKEITLNFSRVEKDATSDRILILKNPSRLIPSSIEDVADLSLQLRLGNETKNVSIEVASVKEFTLRVRLKSVTDIQQIDLDKVHSAVIEVKNPIFILEQLKKAFKQLPYASDDNLQTHLTPRIEFIFGPPGTGKTTYLARQTILPLMEAPTNLKILVLTPTNSVADVLVKKIMVEHALKTAKSHYYSYIPPNNFSKKQLQVTENKELYSYTPFKPLHSLSKEDLEKRLIRFGVTGDSEIENAGLLKDKTFDISGLNRYVVVTTVARFLYDGFSNCQLKDSGWDVIIFDEASMITLAQIVYVLYQQTNCRFIVGGDPFQIQPVVIAKAWQAENIYTLVELKRFQSPKTAPHDFQITHLMTQYRSISPVGALYSQFSYDGMLTHHRQRVDKKLLQLDDLRLTEFTMIKFPVNPHDSIYRSQYLEGGGIYHIYSAIFTVEFALYLATQILKHNHIPWKIGIVCPYLAQATLVEKMLAILHTDNLQLQIVTGTVHRFQGDECDIILTLLNPPPKISTHIFLNNQNILNVAISRAKDYLILLTPEIEGLA